MNKRIQELAEQAEILITEVGAFHNTPHGAYQLQEQHMKKFAELIVRECAKIADSADESACEWIGGNILTHFGVEE
jgi:hypothetical protein